MPAIAGTTIEGAYSAVSEMLEKMNHRGKEQKFITVKEGVTYGVSWNKPVDRDVNKYLESGIACDFKSRYHLAWAKPEDGNFRLYRDETGVAPLYYGYDGEGNLFFASEAKALVSYIKDIKELLPGNELDRHGYHEYFALRTNENPSDDPPEKIAHALKEVLSESVESFLGSEDTGSWLSGGLDSSVICALAAKHIKGIKTFAAGVPGAPDLEYARAVSEFLGTDHHEVVVSDADLLKSIPDVIYYLESFDALLVRSSITNYLVAKRASDFVSRVFSGEGGDELFAGYEYLKSIPAGSLPDELTKITGNLHNTALQRVDRCSMAHGTTANVPFLHPGVVKFAFSIPVKYKIHNNIEKWILRESMKGELPENVLARPKAKFWEGAGVREIISGHADKTISDNDFRNERVLENGWRLNTKEELLYYRIFEGHFGGEIGLDWMGRTEGSPVH
jgi:asparagine synthase (glutamine-hydrolysing)